MGLFRDRRDRRDLSLKVCWTLAVWLMTQQLRCDVNEADEAEQRRLVERHPDFSTLHITGDVFYIRTQPFFRTLPSCLHTSSHMSGHHPATVRRAGPAFFSLLKP